MRKMDGTSAVPYPHLGDDLLDFLWRHFVGRRDDLVPPAPQDSPMTDQPSISEIVRRTGTQRTVNTTQDSVYVSTSTFVLSDWGICGSSWCPELIKAIVSELSGDPGDTPDVECDEMMRLSKEVSEEDS